MSYYSCYEQVDCCIKKKLGKNSLVTIYFKMDAIFFPVILLYVWIKHWNVYLRFYILTLIDFYTHMYSNTS